jgi:hypothetical protein
MKGWKCILDTSSVLLLFIIFLEDLANFSHMSVPLGYFLRVGGFEGIVE